MTAESSKTKNLWYRNPWVWFIIFIPVFTVGLSFSMLYVAVENKDSEVKDDWYKDKKAIRQDFSRDNLATALGINAVITVSGQNFAVKLQSAGMLPAAAMPEKLELMLSHPTDVRKDIRVELARQADGYAGVIPASVEGRYYLEIGCKDWRLKDVIVLPTSGLTVSAKPL
ncbi:MAG TPA: FixH family protein [Fluviicoccus sp.]|nr:FixH family protein [Fluviicoccus sp.]